MDAITPEELKKFDFNFLDGLAFLHEKSMIVARAIKEGLYKIGRVRPAGDKELYYGADAIERSNVKSLGELIEALNDPEKLQEALDRRDYEVSNALYELANTPRNKTEAADALFDGIHTLISQYADVETRGVLEFRLDRAKRAQEMSYPCKTIETSKKIPGLKGELFNLLENYRGDELYHDEAEEREIVGSWFDRKRRTINKYADIGLRAGLSVGLDEAMRAYDKGEFSSKN